MDEERLGREDEGSCAPKLRVPKWLMAFVGILLAEWAVALGLLAGLAYLSFRLRLSLEVVRAWMLLLYIVPCFLGGCIVRRVKLRPSFLWGAGVGMAFYGILFLLASVGGLPAAEPEILIMCVLSALMGELTGRNRRAAS